MCTVSFHFSSHLVIEVAEAAVTLCGSVELCDLRYVKALHELLPDGLTQTVTQCHAHTVTLLHIPHRLIQQVTTDLTDILHYLSEREEKEREMHTVCMKEKVRKRK